jgi:hypothetical protein
MISVRVAAVWALLQAFVLLFMIAGTHGWIVKVDPNTTDYASFYAAGRLAAQGEAPAAYDEARLRAAEQAATQPGVNYEYFFNPPTYLLVMAPFGRLPYLLSFILFEALTAAAWLALGTRVAGGGRDALFCLLAVPSVWWVLGLGQNSFLSASLMAAGTLLLPARPVLAGVAFGALCYKPHLGLMIPVALLAGRQWRAIASAALTVAAAVGATLAWFGTATWSAFLAMAQRSVGGAIDSGKVLFAGRVDPTGAMQQLGLSSGAARVGWLAALVLAAAAVAWLWRAGGRGAPGREARNAGLAAAVLIAAPFALFYDLVMASLAAAWLARAARRDGWLPGEKLACGVLVVANFLAAPMIVAQVHVPFGALAGPVLLALAVRRAQSATNGP